MKAARTLLIRQGYQSTSTAQIAAAAEVSEGIVFHHFGSKQGIFLALAEEFSQAAAAATLPPDHAAVSEAWVVRQAFEFADAHRELYDALARAGTELNLLDVLARNDALIEVLRGKLEAAMSHGKIRIGDAEVMARLQFALVDGAYRAWRTDGDERRKEAYIQEAASCMQAMLRPIS